VRFSRLFDIGFAEPDQFRSWSVIQLKKRFTKRVHSEAVTAEPDKRAAIAAIDANGKDLVFH